MCNYKAGQVYKIEGIPYEVKIIKIDEYIYYEDENGARGRFKSQHVKGELVLIEDVDSSECGEFIGEKSFVVPKADDYYHGDKVNDFIKEFDLNFAKASVIKYVSRAGKKSKDTEIKDLNKAIDYLKYEIKYLDGKE